MAKIQDVITPQFNFAEQGSSPIAPESGVVKIYAKDDGNIYKMDSSGTEKEIGSGSGGGEGSLNALDNGWLELCVGAVEQLTGDVDVSFEDNNVYGYDTLFLSEVNEGDRILINDEYGGVWREVISVVDDTTLVVDRDFDDDLAGVDIFLVVYGYGDTGASHSPEDAFGDFIALFEYLNQYDVIKDTYIQVQVVPHNVWEYYAWFGNLTPIFRNAYIDIVGIDTPMLGMKVQGINGLSISFNDVHIYGGSSFYGMEIGMFDSKIEEEGYNPGVCADMFANVYVSGCEISSPNKACLVSANGSVLFSDWNTGEGEIGLQAEIGGLIAKVGDQPTGTAENEVVTFGGRIVEE